MYQGYLCTEPVELRIRKRVEAGGETVYQICVKSIGKLSRHEGGDRTESPQFEELESMLDKPSSTRSSTPIVSATDTCWSALSWTAGRSLTREVEFI